jgi:hypothetical protein
MKRSSKAISLALSLALLWYCGVDTIPGSFDESLPSPDAPATDFHITDIFEGKDPLVRLQCPGGSGKAISEADEARLLPLLEGLEEAIEQGRASGFRGAQVYRKKLKDLHIFSDAQVDALRTKADLVGMISQMGATVSWYRHFFRIALFALFIVAPGSSGAMMRAIAIELCLIFLPYGHPVTTAGRHFEGERTWAGLRRTDFGLYLLAQFALLMVANNVELGDAGRRLVKRASAAASLASAAFFAWMAHALWSSGALFNFSVSAGDAAAAECGAEFTLAVATKMHVCYLAFLGAGLLRATLEQLRAGPVGSPFSTMARQPQDHWFWFLVMYFSPLEDAAVPMVMACVRQVVTDLSDCSGVDDFLLRPGTTLVELAHFFVTVSAGCHWPVVLWLRVPILLEGATVFCANATYWAAGFGDGTSGWVSADAKTEAVTVYFPVASDFSGAKQLEGKPGYWREHDMDVLMDTEQMSLGSNPAGAMRDVYHLLDPTGMIMTHPSVAMDGINGADKRKLVYKTYRKTDPDLVRAVCAMYGSLEGLYFSDVHMQSVAQRYAQQWNAAAPKSAGTLCYAPAFVMRIKSTGAVHGVECFLDGAYKKWNNNAMTPEVLMGADDKAPTAFCHFTHAVSSEQDLVVSNCRVHDRCLLRNRAPVPPFSNPLSCPPPTHSATSKVSRGSSSRRGRASRARATPPSRGVPARPLC